VTERAFKFTGPGAVSPFARSVWSEAWSTAEGELELCRNGVHACRADALVEWLEEELWLVELDGVEVEREGVVVARRGRVLERVDEWNMDTAAELADDCLARAEELAAETPGENAQRLLASVRLNAGTRDDFDSLRFAAFGASRLAELAAAGGAAAERRRQNDWLGARLGLAG
jgi:hypothetical protein